MSSGPQPNPQDGDALEAPVDQAIAACGGDMRSTVRALIVANDFLESEVSELMKAVSHAYLRGRFHTYSGEERTMAEVTYFVALPFVAAEDGVAAGEPTECFNPTAVVIRAEALSRKPGHMGAVAFSRTGDPATGDFGDAKIIKKFGEGPDDLSTL
jgi:hypothetical protein